MKRLFQIDAIKFYEFLFRLIIWILMACSVVAIIIIHLDLFYSPRFAFDFSRKSIGGYLDIYKEYNGLFTATVTVIVAYLGLQRLKVASDANADKLKQDHFVEWRTVQDVRLIELEKTDPYMKREFIKIRKNLFLQLYELDFNIENKEQLTDVFKANFAEFIPFFESMNERFMEMGGVYQNESFSYTGQNFAFLFNGCIEKGYDQLYNDILDLHRQYLATDRIIDSEMYRSALLDSFSPHRKRG
jgi:hypothetical protein